MCWIEFRDLAVKEDRELALWSKRCGQVVVPGPPTAEPGGVGLVDAGQAAVFRSMLRGVSFFDVDELAGTIPNRNLLWFHGFRNLSGQIDMQ